MAKNTTDPTAVAAAPVPVGGATRSRRWKLLAAGVAAVIVALVLLFGAGMWGHDSGYQSGVTQGHNLGMDAGLRAGHAEGQLSGYKAGEAAGFSRGRTLGAAEAKSDFVSKRAWDRLFNPEE